VPPLTTLHSLPGSTIAEISGDGLIINNPQDALDIMGDLYFQGIGKVILHEKNIAPEFFDLSTGMAGEILQKFSTYRIRLSIVGDFSKYTGKSIRDFIFESNRHGHTTFVASLEEAMKNVKREA
jgi:hypothetical protein